jgi:hypothetical protein
MASAGALGSGAAEGAVRRAFLALEMAVAPANGAVTAATETQVQTAIAMLRGVPDRAETVRRLEEAAVTLRFIVEARRQGRPNLYDSRLVRLRRAVLG